MKSKKKVTIKEESSEESSDDRDDREGGDDGEDEDDKSDEPEEGTPKYFQKAMIATVKEFSVFVAAITADLESMEQEEIKEAEEHNRTVKIALKNGKAKNAKGEMKIKYMEVPKPIWSDSTFKINFTQGLILNMLDPRELIKYYIVYVMPMKKHLEARDEKFFLENDHIYPNAPKEDIVFFKNLWSVDGSMTPEEKNTIWEFWDTLIEIAEDWQQATGWDPDEDKNFTYQKIEI